MGRKHNRRRTRPRYQHRLNDSQRQASPSEHDVSIYPGQANNYRPLLPPVTIAPLDCMSPVPAPTWHDRSGACTSREHRPHHAITKLEIEQYRLFGGVPGDDTGLCFRMLEYFGGLDYIDT